MASLTVKLQTNIPVSGTVNYVDFMPTKNPDYKDQIAVRGDWEGAGEGRIYLPLALENELTKLGVIGPRSANNNYPLLLQKPQVKFTKTENGNSKITKVELLGSGGARTTASTGEAASASNAARSTTQSPKGVTVADLAETLEDSFRIAGTILDNLSMEKTEIREVATTLFIARTQRGLYGKTEVPAPF